MTDMQTTEDTTEIALETWLQEQMRLVVPSRPYNPPTVAERSIFVSGLWELLSGAQDSPQLARLGLTVARAIDSGCQRQFLLIGQPNNDVQAWGFYIIDLSMPVRGLVAAPHPVFDENSEYMALQIWRETPGLLLAVSGTHRTDASGQNIRDVAHQPGSMFHAVALEAIRHRWPQFQQHGYRDASDLMHDVIISSGDSHDTAGLHRLADAVEGAGFNVARNWDGTAKVLAGFTNIQSEAAGLQKAPFAHVEVSHSVRMDVELCKRYLAAVKQAGYFDTN
ncbi:MAG TPA: hypothetical protein VFZ48_03165 [Candidatus Saccharimonadales bacterium]